MDKFNYKLPYPKFFGGVTAFSTDDFIGANGCPNVYWGWGGEDDDMYLRVIKQLKKSITRYPIEIARYKMIRHKSAPVNPDRRKILYSGYDYSLDGVNNTQYKLHRVTFYKLFTLVNVTLIEETYQQIRTRLKIKDNTRKR
jgi:beta-1,4-galactosyltransferase 3